MRKAEFREFFPESPIAARHIDEQSYFFKIKISFFIQHFLVRMRSDYLSKKKVMVADGLNAYYLAFKVDGTFGNQRRFYN